MGTIAEAAAIGRWSRKRWVAVKADQIRYMDLTIGLTLFTSIMEVSGSEPKGEIR